MVKLQQGYLKSRLPEALSSSDSEEGEEQVVPVVPPKKKLQQVQADDEEESDHSYDEVDSDVEIAAAAEEGDFEEAVREKFGQRGVNEEAKLLERLAEIRANFYNRLSSQKLIKNTKGRIPFTEHMTISKAF